MHLCLSELRPLVNACACASVRASRVRYPVHLCGPVPLFGTFNICVKSEKFCARKGYGMGVRYPIAGYDVAITIAALALQRTLVICLRRQRPRRGRAAR